MNEINRMKGSDAATLDNVGLIRLAILAVGGQGGGVLTNWVLDLAEANGYVAQTTSVPGVAQRTGATIYYIEMLPLAEGDATPVLALMPSPGDVDIVVAAEIMEAGRAVTRGLVSADRTTVVASSHRMYAVSEKIVPGDGIADGSPVLKGVEKSARKVICHDLQAIAETHGSHISASLFGALAGSGALPFERAQFEQTIRASGRGVESSLKAFGTAFDLASGATTPQTSRSPTSAEDRPRPEKSGKLARAWNALEAQIKGLPEPARSVARAGLAKTVDYQDVAYGQDYLDLLGAASGRDISNGGADRGFSYSKTLARHLANAMCYDDVFRVADLKTRGSRMTRVRADVAAPGDEIVHITEYMHPRADEIIGLMPARMGRFVEARPRLVALISRFLSKGRRLRTDRIGPFLLLYGLGGMRRFRRGTFRHRQELTHRDKWLDLADRTLENNYGLAVEILNARRLIKGYSDTHSRGLSKYDRVLDGIELVAQREDAADWARRLMSAALSDAGQEELDGAIATIRGFL